MKESDFTPLIQGYLDGNLDAAGMGALNRQLAVDEEARREFAEWLDLDAALGAMAAAGAGSGNEVRLPSSRFSAGLRAALAMAAAVALLLAVGGIWLAQRESGYATVAGGTSAPELSAGSPVSGEFHTISGGTVEFLTALGARIVIEAPAEFRFESPQRLHLLRGRLSADVPPAARGFTVVTPSGDAVDLGTRFGVDVPENGASEIHVFEGEVIAQGNAAAGSPRSLRGGEAFTMDKVSSSDRELRDGAFIGSEEVPALAAGLAAGQQARAERALAEYRHDPDLIALLDFENNDRLPPGEYRMVQGRWPGSRAPEFIHAGDHMALDAASGLSFQQMTMAAWVRLDRLGAPYQSLLHTDGWSEGDPGNVHWMINRDTTMRLALYGNRMAPPPDGPGKGFPDSLTPVLPEQGRWVHLAVVYDAEARRVRFFLNGAFDHEAALETAHPARFGPSRIGNWIRSDRKLSGRIDEFLLLGRALSEVEIAALFEAGNPYR